MIDVQFLRTSLTIFVSSYCLVLQGRILLQIRQSSLQGRRIWLGEQPFKCNVAILDEETDRGLGKPKNDSKGEDDGLKIEQGEKFQNGGLTQFSTSVTKKRLLCRLQTIK